MAKTKLALIGVGDVAQRDYLPEFHRIAARAEIVDVAGRAPERARATAERVGARWHADYQRMLQETEAEAVLNLTPIQLHVEVTLAALDAGKHVYTEKPAASTGIDVRRIQAAAEAHGRTVICAPCVMRFPQVLHAKALLDAGAIGAVHLARGRGWGGVPPWSGYASDPAPFFARGGGALRDMGVYPLHALTGLLGRVQRVMAMCAQAQQDFQPVDGPSAGRRIPMEEPDAWLLVLDFGGDRIATLEANNAAQATRAPDLELFGLRGTIGLSLIYCGAPVDVMKAEGDWAFAPQKFPSSGRASGPDHLLGVEHLLDVLQHDAAPVLTLAHAAHVIDVIDAAIQSAESGVRCEVWDMP